VRQTILAIDDEPDMLRLIERIVTSKSPYSLTTTNNSLEVPDLLENNDFDLIVTDLKMPGMSGLDILKYVKQNKRREKVIIITAFGSYDTVMEALALGVFDYITKPFKKEEILFTLDRAMRWQRLEMEMDRVEQICNTEPYSEAERVFKIEYITRLRERCQNDRELMTIKSGIPPDQINQILE